jgi:hypothetical protein
MTKLIGTMIDPRGVLIGWDTRLELYFWSDIHDVWVHIHYSNRESNA